MTTRVLVIAGTARRVGKTTVTLGSLEAYRWRHDGGGAEAYLIHRALLSYVHLYFASNPELPRASVAACAHAR
jgi:cobyrinic acid a,c-diamide synthase